MSARMEAPFRAAPARAGAPTDGVALRDDEAVLAMGQVTALLGLAFGLMAFAFEALIMGPVGITLGLIGKHSGTALGRVAVCVAMLGTILGPTFGSVVYAALFAG